MSTTLSPPVIAPDHTFAMPAISDKARGAAFLLTMSNVRDAVTIDLEQLPPQQSFDHLGAIYVSNINNTVPVYVTFEDSAAICECPAGGTAWFVAVTGRKRFAVSAAFPGVAQLEVQCVNFLVSPTGSSQVTATISGSVTVSNPGPVNGTPVDHTGASIPATTNTLILAANAAREYLLMQMPQASGGWVNLTSGAASVAGNGCFYMQAGEKYQSQGYVPNGSVHVFLDTGGVVPVIEG